ncbi:Zinc finger and BTB domain-containing protein 7A [Oryzias melastigma]|uniref:Zinc finger and BTB domain-containing protein 7A n=1 Tax=Oryzias melastigma TaxID=30732 RepID=A0A834FSL8_ORYME|nr:Zinc finger and BTB domain-containing protein 7A [Oryzias melastigma]
MGGEGSLKRVGLRVDITGGWDITEEATVLGKLVTERRKQPPPPCVRPLHHMIVSETGRRDDRHRQQAHIFFWVYGLEVAMSPGEDGLIGIPFPEHSNELLSHLNDQRRTGILCDLTLTSRGARYPTHRSVMAAVSLYFRWVVWS